jgi:phage host-nuclease inhibitor protein Gam
MSDFAITDLKTLEWYVDKQTSIEERQERIRTQATAMIADLEREAESLRFQFEHQAHAVLEAHLSTSKSRTKHVKFLTGSIGKRMTPARLTVTHNSRACAWANEHAPELLDTRIDTRRLTARFKVQENEAGTLELLDGGTSEILALPDGLEIKPSEVKYYVGRTKTNTETPALEE